MDYRSETVALDRIDLADTTYHVTTDTATDDLRATISTDGLINPPILITKDSGYRIVSGFRRVRACGLLGWEILPARILGPGIDGLAAARLAIADNAFQRPLNLVESSRAVALLASHFESARDIASAAGGLGLSVNVDMTKKLLALNRLPQALQDGVLEASLSLPTALELGAYPRDNALMLADLFSHLKPSLNRQREFLDLIKEISQREGVSMDAILRTPQAATIIRSPDMDRNRKTRLLRDYLRQRRFPHLTAGEQSFKRSVKELNLAPGISLIPPKHFEGSVFILTLPFKSLEELKQHQDTLTELIPHPAMNKILSKQ